MTTYDPLADECHGEMIDGMWESGGCGCQDCLDFEAEEHALADERGSEWDH